MGARRFVLICYAFLVCELSLGLILNRHSQDIRSKSKVKLTPLFASSRLNDMIIISAPIINAKYVRYCLNKPNGDVIKFNIKQKKNDRTEFKNLGNDILVKNMKGAKAVIKPVDDLKMFSLKYENFTSKEKEMGKNDVAIGPLTADDHGNWVLSVYYEDLDGEWIELFQVITVEIVEVVPAKSKDTIFEGEVFTPSFAYPIKDLKSCELIAPSTTFDRLYGRSQVDFKDCGYVVENVTKSDEGTWTIIGVGKIVYETQIVLTVLNKIA